MILNTPLSGITHLQTELEPLHYFTMNTAQLTLIHQVTIALAVACLLVLGSAFQNQLGLVLTWPVGGLTVFLAWQYGFRSIAIAIAAGALISLAFTPMPWLASAQRVVATLLTPLIGGYLLRRSLPKGQLDSVRCILILFFFGAIVATALSSLLAALMMLSAVESFYQISPVWWACWNAEAIAILLILPVLLKPRSRPRIAFWSLLLAVLISATIAYAGILPQSFNMAMPLSYLSMPFLLIAAFWLPLPQVGALLLANGIIALIGTTQGLGPFTQFSLAQSILSLQAHLAISSCSVLLVAASIAERSAVSAALRESNEQLNFVLNNQSGALILSEANGEIKFASPSSAALLTDIQSHSNIFQWLRNTGLSPTQQKFTNTDHHDFIHRFNNNWLHWKVSKTAPNDARSELIWVANDVTSAERAKIEARTHLNTLTQIGRLSDMTQLAGGLAHELNQPLTAATSFAQAARHLLDKYDHNNLDKLRTVLDKVVGNANRAATIVRDSRALLRAETINHNPIPLGPLLSNTVSLLELELRNRHVQIEFHGLNNVKIVAATSQLQQVFINLLRNAIKALEHSNPAEISITVSRSKQSIIIDFKDNGSGLHPQVTEKLFSPFNSYHEGGIGLGLSISRTIIESHQGSIESITCNQGAWFQIQLPEVRDESSIPDTYY